MTDTSSCRALTRICGVAVLLTSLALITSALQALETTAVSGHICNGCPACDQVEVPTPRAVEHACVDHHHRSGHPEMQGRFAKPSLNLHYSFGYVGGGAAFRGEPRFADEGTWGVDYSGILIKKKIWLPWLHGQRAPRHDGSYRTDGPHLLRHE